MPEISLLQPLVLRGLVEKFTAPQNLTLLNSVPQTPWPYPSAQWEIIRGARAVARPNVPNSEAHIVPRLGRDSASASFIYLREKKVFEPTTLHWLRQAAQNVSDLARTNAEQAVLREVGDLNQRFDNFAEFSLWRALSGSLNLNFPDVQASVDYKFLPTHKPTADTPWDEATPTQIIANVRAWKRLVQTNGRVQAKVAYATEDTIDQIFTSFASAGTSPANLLSDRMKDEYYRSGVLPGFLGLDWRPESNVYDANGAAYTPEGSAPGSETLFLPHNRIVIGDLTTNRPIELMIGPTADDEAPEGFTGKFAKTWKDKDPSARQHLLEWNILPVITRPEQVVYASVGA